MSADTVVVGADLEDSSTTGVNNTPNESALGAGAAYVFVRNGTIWSQQAYLKAHQVSGGDEFGRSVAVSADTVVVGAWLEDSSTTGVNSMPNESALGAGAAYVFARSGTNWTQQAYLKAHQVSTGDWFSGSVAVDGDTVVIGAILEDSGTTGVNSTPNESAYDAGAAYVFTRSGTNWTQQAYLKASNTPGGSDASDLFGYSVAADGDTVVVGALFEDSSTTGVNSTPDESATNSGAAFVFVRSGTNWTQQAYLKAHQISVGDRFGSSVAVDANTVVVGATLEDSSTTGSTAHPTRVSLVPERHMCLCAAARIGLSRLTSRPIRCRRWTSSGSPWRRTEIRWWSEPMRKTAARRESTARPTRAPRMPERRMCLCAAGRIGVSRRTSRLIRFRRMTSSAIRWR